MLRLCKGQEGWEELCVYANKIAHRMLARHITKNIERLLDILCCSSGIYLPGPTSCQPFSPAALAMQLDLRYSTLLVLRYTDLQQTSIQSLDSKREAVVEKTIVPGVICLTTLAQLASPPPASPPPSHSRPS